MTDVLVVDGSNLAHRCRHTFSLSFRDLDVSVTYGFLRTLESVMTQEQPTVVVVCWDGGAPKYRYEHTPTYKRHTHVDDASYPEFLIQMQELQDVLPGLGVVSIKKIGCEADDLMYAATQLLGGHKTILTTDQDLYQAIKPDVDVLSPTKNLRVMVDNFEEVVGVRPEAYLVYKAMVGDSSDGVPGILGIGEKTAAKLIQQYGARRSDITRAAVMDKEMPQRLRDKIREYGTEGFFNAMMTIRLDMDLCGARLAMLKAIETWQPYDHMFAKEFLGMYAMVSLQDPQFYNVFRRLEDPALHMNDVSGLRMPASAPVYGRHPVG